MSIFSCTCLLTFAIISDVRCYSELYASVDNEYESKVENTAVTYVYRTINNKRLTRAGIRIDFSFFFVFEFITQNEFPSLFIANNFFLKLNVFFFSEFLSHFFFSRIFQWIKNPLGRLYMNSTDQKKRPIPSAF